MRTRIGWTSQSFLLTIPLTILALSLFPSSARARLVDCRALAFLVDPANPPPEVVSLQGGTKVRILRMDPGVTPADEARVGKVIADTNRHLGKLKAPKEVEIRLRSDDKGFFANRVDRVLYLSTRPSFDVRERVLTKHPKHAEGSQAHEYGHRVFWENTEGVLGPERKVYDELVKLSAKTAEARDRAEGFIRAFQEEHKAIRKRIQETSNFSEAKELGARLDAVDKAIDAIVSEANRIRHEFEKRVDEEEAKGLMVTDVEPLEELFCDVLEVNATDNPSSAAQGTYFAGIKETYRAELPQMDPKLTENQREKIARYESRKYKARDFLARNSLSGPYSDDQHSTYAPTRTMLGKYFTSPRFRNNKPAIAEAVLDSIVEEIEVAKKNPAQLRDFQKNGKALNEQLIARIKAKLGPL